MAANLEEILKLLMNLLSSENDVRKQAEEAYENIPGGTKVVCLLEVMQNFESRNEVRQMAAVLLRRLFCSSFDDVYSVLNMESQSAVKQRILSIIQTENDSNLRKKFCSVAAELAQNLMTENCVSHWPEVLKFLFDCASSEQTEMKECALLIFHQFPGIFGNQQAHYLSVIKQMLYECLIDKCSPQVRFLAARAMMVFLITNVDDNIVQRHFTDLTQAILQVVSESVTVREDDLVLKGMVELAESVPKFLRGQVENYLTLCLKIAADTTLDNTWRQLGLEGIVTLGENAPAMIRKHSQLMGLLIPQVLAFMVDLEEDPAWEMCDDDDEDNDSNSVAGETALDRLACGLGGKAILPHVTASVPLMLASPDWRYRHSAMIAIAAIGEGCHKQMQQLLPEILTAILPFLQDSHPRVRYAACNAIGQMSTDFAGVLQKGFHEQIVPGLLHTMESEQNVKVQAHAAAALVNFAEDCPKNILEHHLDAILMRLEKILSVKIQELMASGTKMVLEQIVTTLAAVADTAEEKFINHYGRFMPCLKYIMQNATCSELRLLRGKTIECISLIGLAVGTETFMPDASDVMQLLLKTQTDVGEYDDDDPQVGYMISAWARMCKLLGKDFQQYLPVVMGPLMKVASFRPEIAIVDSDQEKEMQDEDGWQFVTLGDQQSFGIKTSGLEEKSTACQMLVCYAKELKEAFAEYCEEVVKLMVPLLKFYFHETVRCAAAESLPCLLECATVKGTSYMAEMWNYIFPELMKAIESEPEYEITSQLLESMAKCISFLGDGCLTEAQIYEVVEMLNKQMEYHFKRGDERQEKRNDEDYDDVVEETLQDENEEDVLALMKISDIIHALFSTYRDKFLPYFDVLAHHFSRLLRSGRPWTDHQWGLCVFDDVIEFVGPSASKYQEFFLQPMLEFVVDKAPEVRQASAYGIGVMAQFGKGLFDDSCGKALPLLSQVITQPESRATSENVAATENAISAVTKILKFTTAGHLYLSELIPAWLSWLPITEDQEEAVHVNGYLCDLIEMNDMVLLGHNNINLPKVVSVIAEVIGSQTAGNDETLRRLINIVHQVHTNSEIWPACLAHLSDPQKQVLVNALDKAR